VLSISASATSAVTDFQKTFIAGFPESLSDISVEKFREPESEFICAAFLENLKLGVRIQRLKNIECREPEDWSQPSVSSAMEYLSLDFVDGEENVEKDVGVTRSEPFLEGEMFGGCWIDTCEIGLHCTGNSRKRESP